VFLLRAERYAGSETEGLLSGTVYRRMRIASAGDAGRRPSSPDGDKDSSFSWLTCRLSPAGGIAPAATE